MMQVAAFYGHQPYLVWLAVACLFLATEVATATGWLLWPAGTGAVMVVLTLAGVRLGGPADTAVFAVLTLAAILAAKRLMPRRAVPDGPDINDVQTRLIGLQGEAATAFKDGRGRVLVEGKEWTAELEGGGPLAQGARVSVVRVTQTSHLVVQAA